MFFPPCLTRDVAVCIFVLKLAEVFTSTETVGLLGTEARDGHLDFHTAPELCTSMFLVVLI